MSNWFVIFITGNLVTYLFAYLNIEVSHNHAIKITFVSYFGFNFLNTIHAQIKDKTTHKKQENKRFSNM